MALLILQSPSMTQRKMTLGGLSFGNFLVRMFDHELNWCATLSAKKCNFFSLKSKVFVFLLKAKWPKMDTSFPCIKRKWQKIFSYWYCFSLSAKPKRWFFSFYTCFNILSKSWSLSLDHDSSTGFKTT